MKKLAVLVGGEFREFESAHLSWPFLSLDHDFFISTWDTTTEKNPKLNINLREEVSSARILKHFPNAHINIEPDIMDVDNSKNNVTTGRNYLKWQTILRLNMKPLF